MHITIIKILLKNHKKVTSLSNLKKIYIYSFLENIIELVRYFFLYIDLKFYSNVTIYNQHFPIIKITILVKISVQRIK